MYKQGDIIAVHYPFSDDYSKTKFRPAIIISNNSSNKLDKDFLICQITSKLKRNAFSFVLKDEYLSKSMPRECEVRCNKVITVRDALIEGKYCEMKSNFLKKLVMKVKNSIDVE